MIIHNVILIFFAKNSIPAFLLQFGNQFFACLASGNNTFPKCNYAKRNMVKRALPLIDFEKEPAHYDSSFNVFDWAKFRQRKGAIKLYKALILMDQFLSC